VLVLLTRPFSRESLPRREGVTYVQPSRAVPVAKWDYTSPDRVREAYDLGREDGARFARQRLASRAA
jgi:hypothetical protein